METPQDHLAQRILATAKERFFRVGLRALTMEARSIPGMKAFLRTVTLGEQAMPPE